MRGFTMPGFGGRRGDLAREDALAHHFREQDGGGSRDIERVGRAQHWDAHAEVGIIHEFGGEAILFAAETERHATGEILLKVELFCVRSGGHDGKAVRLEPREGVLRGGNGNGERKERACGGADDIGIMNVGAGVTHNHCGDTRSISAAEHGAEIARFFNGFADQDKRIGREIEIFERLCDEGACGEEAVGAFAVGNFGKDGLGACIETRAQLLALAHDGGFVLMLKPELFAIKERFRAITMIQRAADFTVALGEHNASIIAVAPLAQLHDLLDFWIRKTSNFGNHA